MRQSLGRGPGRGTQWEWGLLRRRQPSEQGAVAGAGDRSGQRASSQELPHGLQVRGLGRGRETLPGSLLEALQVRDQDGEPRRMLRRQSTRTHPRKGEGSAQGGWRRTHRTLHGSRGACDVLTTDRRQCSVNARCACHLRAATPTASALSAGQRRHTEKLNSELAARPRHLRSAGSSGNSGSGL